MKMWCASPMLVAAAVLFLAPAGAFGQGSQIETLKKENRALRTEVEALKTRLTRLEAVKPTFTTFMPNFSERFHVMHFAGDAGDWQLAQHELLELERLLDVAQSIDPGKGKLMEGFLAGNMRSLNAAIEHGNHKLFRKALEETVVNCNKCHEAVGSSFLKVSLDVRKAMTIRHPHALSRSKMMGDHKH